MKEEEPKNAEAIKKDIRRRTKRKFSSEEKIRIVFITPKIKIYPFHCFRLSGGIQSQFCFKRIDEVDLKR
jgi:hypothetical protein